MGKIKTFLFQHAAFAQVDRVGRRWRLIFLYPPGAGRDVEIAGYRSQEAAIAAAFRLAGRHGWRLLRTDEEQAPAKGVEHTSR